MIPYQSSENRQEGWSSGVFLVLANLIPLFGALVLDWSVFDIVLVYWAENVVIGVYNVLKMLTVRPGGRNAVGLGGKLFLSLFFLVHYGGFCAGHGVFVVTLLGDDSLEGGFFMAKEALTGPLLLAVLMLILSHGYSYFRNYLGRGENAKTDVGEQMFAPYGRIIVLHVAIIAGGMAVQAANEPTYLLVILVVGKILFDLNLHRRSHRKKGAMPAEARHGSLS